MENNQNKPGKLLARMLLKFGGGFLVIGLVLFAGAGTFRYWNSWLILGLAVPMAVFGVYLLVKDPATLKRRLKSKEPDKKQGAVIALSGVAFLVSFLLAGLDFRFGWSHMPPPVSIVALIAMLLGHAMFMAVILQNAYASRVVEVAQHQKLITTGLYSVVRHPMYTASLVMFVAMPFVLDSYFAVLPMPLYPVAIVRRVKSEERLLAEQLDGYKDYLKQTKYRIVPYVW